MCKFVADQTGSVCAALKGSECVCGWRFYLFILSLRSAERRVCNSETHPAHQTSKRGPGTLLANATSCQWFCYFTFQFSHESQAVTLISSFMNIINSENIFRTYCFIDQMMTNQFPDSLQQQKNLRKILSVYFKQTYNHRAEGR